MQKKRKKKSWRRNNDRHVCNCWYCIGDFMERLIQRTRVRRKFSKYPQLVIEE